MIVLGKITRILIVYDIKELFRWLIDVSVIQLLKEKKIRKADFIIPENYYTRLGENITKILSSTIAVKSQADVKNSNHVIQFVMTNDMTITDIVSDSEALSVKINIDAPMMEILQ